MLLSIVILLLSLGVITLGADFLVRGSVSIAQRLGLSSFFIGLTLVGFGTSTPELGAAVTAALRGVGEMAVGNVVGSNILNVCVILGLTAILNPIPVRVRAIRREAYVVVGVALVPFLAWLSRGDVARWEGALMVAVLGVYVWRSFVAARNDQSPDALALARDLETALKRPGKTFWSTPGGAATLIGAGLAMLAGGSYFLVDSASTIARALGVSELVIGLTVVAGGTSAPELVTSLVAAVRRQTDVAVGNILGSNIFNILGILGITALVQPQAIPYQTLVLDAPVMLVSSVALLPIALSAARISRTEGAVLLAGYIAYAFVLFAFVPRWFAQPPA